MTTQPYDVPPASEDHGGLEGHDSARRVARGVNVVSLRLSGLTYDQIAVQAGYGDKSSARHAVMRALDRHEADSVAELRALENARLDRANAAIWPKVIAGDARALDSWLRLSQRRARLNGLDAPVQVAISGGLQAELEDALAELAEQIEGEVTSVTDEPYTDDED